MKDVKLEFKMRLVKKAINRLVPRLLRLVSEVEATTPQSRLLLRVWARLEEVLDREQETKCFHDNNFRDLLQAIKRALVFLCEKDKYYKRWLGLLAIVLSEELEKMYADFSYEEALNMTTRPLGLTLEEFDMHKEALWLLHLSGYLHSLSLMSSDGREYIRQAREQNIELDLFTVDKNAIVKLVFPKDSYMSFAMLFLERHRDYVVKS